MPLAAGLFGLNEMIVKNKTKVLIAGGIPVSWFEIAATCPQKSMNGFKSSYFKWPKEK
jgi:hypothetical protein